MKKSLCFMSLLLASQGFVSFLPAMFKAPGSESEGANGHVPAANFSPQDRRVVVLLNPDGTPKELHGSAKDAGVTIGIAKYVSSELEKTTGVLSELIGSSFQYWQTGVGSANSPQQRVGYESRSALTYPSGSNREGSLLSALPAPASPEVSPADQWSFKNRNRETSGLGWSAQPVQGFDEFSPRQNGWTVPSSSSSYKVAEDESYGAPVIQQPMDHQPATAHHRKERRNATLRHADSLRVSRSDGDAVLTKPMRRTESSRYPRLYVKGLSFQGDQHSASQTLPGSSSKRRPSKAAATTEQQSNQYLSMGYGYNEKALGGYGSSSSRSTNSDDVMKPGKHSKKTTKKKVKETRNSSPLVPAPSNAPPPPPPPPPMPEPGAVPSGPTPASVNNNADSQKKPLQSAGKQPPADLMAAIRKGKKLTSVDEAGKKREEKRKKAQSNGEPAGTPSSGQTSETTKSVAELLKEVMDSRKPVVQESESDDDGSETEEDCWSDEDETSITSSSSKTVSEASEPLSRSVSSISAASSQTPPKQSSGNQAPEITSPDLKSSEEPSAYEEDLYERLKREKAAQAEAEKANAENQQPQTAAEVFGGTKLKKRTPHAGSVQVFPAEKKGPLVVNGDVKAQTQPKAEKKAAVEEVTVSQQAPVDLLGSTDEQSTVLSQEASQSPTSSSAQTKTPEVEVADLISFD